MYHFNEIKEDYSSRNIILPKLRHLRNEPEMIESESAFLCGVLSKIKAKKVVEVGVAGGGTTAIMMQHLEQIWGVMEAIFRKYMQWIFRPNFMRARPI